MQFESNKYTILLALFVLFIAWYYYQSSNESFKSKKGISKITKSIKGKSISSVRREDVTPPPRVPVQIPTVVSSLESGEIDFSKIM